jgi:cell division protein FtsB
MNPLRRTWDALASRWRNAGGRRALLSSTTGRLTLLALVLAVAAWFVLRDHGLLDHARLRDNLDSLRKRADHLQTRIDWYRGRNERLAEGDSFTLEEEARHLGMARPGEELYRVVLPEDTASAPPPKEKP